MQGNCYKAKMDLSNTFSIRKLLDKLNKSREMTCSNMKKSPLPEMTPWLVLKVSVIIFLSENSLDKVNKSREMTCPNMKKSLLQEVPPWPVFCLVFFGGTYLP